MTNCHERECLHCKEFFRLDYRNRHHQKFCSKPECRQASKAQSQRHWLSKPSNRDYFRGPEQVERVRQWRKKNPGYWKRSQQAAGTLQEVCSNQPLGNKAFASQSSQAPLQDVLDPLLRTQDPLLVGLIAQLIDSSLQEHIESATRRLILKGQSILGMKPGRPTTSYENKETGSLFGAAAAHSRTVQLDRSTSGP